MRLERNDPDIPILLGITGAGQLRRLFDRSRIMDLVGHKVLWVTPLQGAPPQKVFEFPDASVRIDYPVWSPDGKWVALRPP